jgi:hypothetical protein
VARKHAVRFFRQIFLQHFINALHGLLTSNLLTRPIFFTLGSRSPSTISYKGYRAKGQIPPNARYDIVITSFTNNFHTGTPVAKLFAVEICPGSTDACITDVMRNLFISIVPDDPAHTNIQFFGGGYHEEKLDHHSCCRFDPVAWGHKCRRRPRKIRRRQTARSSKEGTADDQAEYGNVQMEDGHAVEQGPVVL